MTDVQIRERFIYFFCKRILSESLLNAARLLQVMLNNTPVKVRMPNAMSVPAALGTQLYFSTAVFFSRKVGKKTRTNTKHALNSSLAGMGVQLMQKAFNALTESSSHETLRAVVEP